MIYRGYHSYINSILPQYQITRYNRVYSRELTENKLCVCEFVIPKGSTYYKNEKENIYVSNKIKFIQEIK